MCVEPDESKRLNSERDSGQESVQEFERRLRRALEPQPAPPWLKQRVLAQARSRVQERRQARQSRWWALQRIAASAVLAAIFGGFAAYHQFEEHRRGEEARSKVLTALRIAGRTLERAGERANDPSNDRLTDEAR
jgi:hypothetical protein